MTSLLSSRGTPTRDIVVSSTDQIVLFHTEVYQFVFFVTSSKNWIFVAFQWREKI